MATTTLSDSDARRYIYISNDSTKESINEAVEGLTENVDGVTAISFVASLPENIDERSDLFRYCLSEILITGVPTLQFKSLETINFCGYLVFQLEEAKLASKILESIFQHSEYESGGVSWLENVVLSKEAIAYLSMIRQKG